MVDKHTDHQVSISVQISSLPHAGQMTTAVTYSSYNGVSPVRGRQSYLLQKLGLRLLLHWMVAPTKNMAH